MTNESEMRWRSPKAPVESETFSDGAESLVPSVRSPAVVPYSVLGIVLDADITYSPTRLAVARAKPPATREPKRSLPPESSS